MYELSSKEWPLAAAFYREIPYGNSIPNAVIEGVNPGRVFVDDPAHPTVAFVWNSGFCYVSGSTEHIGFTQKLADWLLHDMADHFFMLYSFPETWDPVLAAALGRAADRWHRANFDFNPATFATLGDWETNLPSGYVMERIDAGVMQRIGEEIHPFSRRIWPSARDFAAKGIGFCLTRERQIVSLCYSAFIGNGHYEIDILTVEEFRGQGLGTLTACAFIDECLANGLTPNWDCFADNVPSYALARKLGFEERIVFPVFVRTSPEPSEGTQSTE